MTAVAGASRPLAAISLPNSNPMRVVLLSLLIFEVIVFGLAVPVMILTAHVSPSVAFPTAGAAAVLALAAAGFMRTDLGYLLGWLTQLAGIALGLLIPIMFIIGAMFAGLWLMSFVLGRRLEARAAAAAAD